MKHARRLKAAMIAVAAGAAVMAFAAPAHAGTTATPPPAVPGTAHYPANGPVAPQGSAPLIHGITEQCDNASLLCLNDQANGGQASPVNMYYGGYANDAFTWTWLSLMCHDGHVHANAPYGPCPFPNGSGLNAQLDGTFLFSLNYQRQNLCVGTTSADAGHVIMVSCPDALGNGGGWGSIYAEGYVTSNCAAGNDYWAESRYWSGVYGTQASLESPGGVLSQAFINPNTPHGTCWGQFVS